MPTHDRVFFTKEVSSSDQEYMTRQQENYLIDFETAYGDRPDYGFLLGVFGQVVTEHDPDCMLPVDELLEIFYDRIQPLGVEVLDIKVVDRTAGESWEG